MVDEQKRKRALRERESGTRRAEGGMGGGGDGTHEGGTTPKTGTVIHGILLPQHASPHPPRTPQRAPSRDARAIPCPVPATPRRSPS